MVVFAIHSDESAMSVHACPILTSLPPPTPSHPTGSSQCTSPEHRVSCIELGLVTYFIYDNIHVSMLFSQTITCLLSPQSPKVCSLHLSLLFCLAYTVIATIFLNSIYMCYLFFLTYFAIHDRLQFHPAH